MSRTKNKEWDKKEWETVAMCADAAECSYEETIRPRKGFRHIATVDATKDPSSWGGYFDRAVLLRRDDDLLLAFRGTVSANWRSEWMTNLSLSFGWFTGGVHKGFARAVDRVWENVRAKIKDEEPIARLLVTGHSKGAGMACVAAAHLIRSGRKDVRLITFSEPPVYNLFSVPKVWKELAACGLQDHRRLIHTVDFLPMLTMFFSSHSPVAVFDSSNCVRYSRGGPLAVLWKSAADAYKQLDPLVGVARHGMAGYRALSYECAGIPPE
jgi:hypothetical protein